MFIPDVEPSCSNFVAAYASNRYRFAMQRPARIIAIALGGCCAVLIIGYVAFFWFVRTEAFREQVEAALSARTGAEVRLADLRLEVPLTFSAAAAEVSRRGAFALKTKRVALDLTPLDLWLNTLHGVQINQPVLELDLDQMIRTPRAGASKLGIRQLQVRDGRLLFTRAGQTVFELPKINAHASNVNIGESSGITLRADLAEFGAETEWRVAGRSDGVEAHIIVRAKPTAGLFSAAPGRDLPQDFLRLRAILQAPANQPANGTLAGTFEKIPVGEQNVSGTVNLRAAIDRSWTQAALTGNLRMDDAAAVLALTGLKLPTSAASAVFTGAFSLADNTLAVESLELVSPLGKIDGRGHVSFATGPHIKAASLRWRDIPLEKLQPTLPAPLRSASIAGRGEVDFDLQGPLNALAFSGTARATGVKLQASELETKALDFSLPFESRDGAARISRGKIVATEVRYDAKSWMAAATELRINASAELITGTTKIAGSLAAGGGKFSSVDGSKAGENLRVDGPLEITWTAGEATNVRGNLTAQSGELLWDKFYANLAGTQPTVQLDGTYRRDRELLDCRGCSISLRQVGTVAIKGAIEGHIGQPSFDLELRSSNFSPGALFDRLLRENLNRRLPWLEKLVVAGEAAFQTRLSGRAGNLAAAGEVSIRSGALRGKSNDWELAEIVLDLPFNIVWKRNGKNSAQAPRTGRLSVGKIRFGAHTARLSDTALSLVNNELRFREPLRAAVFGGELIVRDLVWPDIIVQPQELSFAAECKRLQLEELTRAFGWPLFTGTLTGSIPQVESSDGVLKTSGEIEAEIFGGRARLSKLDIENPFSPLASIRLDARLANIDLEQLSRTFAFGQISGILEGTIADLIITDGQPAQFVADLHTVDRGTEQRISVEALNKITVLSSGQSAGALYGGLAGLFDSFRYSKLGFKATLRNDRLTLRGVETRGDQEFLVVGTFLPPTVNVVSHTQAIAFSELLRRLERVSSEAPEIK
jgi:hypothetical protein